VVAPVGLMRGELAEQDVTVSARRGQLRGQCLCQAIAERRREVATSSRSA
jgi:hypothetical protein